MAGHLFLTRGDLRNLACDATLIPSGTHSGRFGHVGNRVWTGISRLAADASGFVFPSPDRSTRAVEVAPRRSIAEPALWVAHTGDTAREQPRWYADALKVFVQKASEAYPQIRSGSRPVGDPRPLLGVPLVGVGQGGMEDRKGEVMLAVIEALHEALSTVDADVALVLNSAESFSAAQHARERVLGDDAWTSLDDGLTAHGRHLARRARDRGLVLFIGAGASVGAGLPSWSELLGLLADDAGLDDREKAELDHLDARDAGAILAQRLRQRDQRLPEAVARRTRTDRVSLVHQLLASLPVSEAVTTNYDTCFERAWKDAGRKPRVLPVESAHDSSCWLLKLHGSVDDPQRIVLAREDYLRLEGEGAALGGVVQAMLLTRHMLFAGYSLKDDNFHRIMHQVRAATGSADLRPGGGRFGTALTPARNPLAQSVWQDDIAFVSTADAQGQDDPRTLAVLLDFVASRSTAPAAHLLDDSYRAMFTPAEMTLRDRLRDLRAALDEHRLDLPSAVVEAFDDALGRIAAQAPA